MIKSIKNIIKQRIWILSLICLFAGISDIHAQCKIVAPITKLCRGNSVTFTVNATAASYLWNSGDGKTENKQIATFLYDHYGTFKLKVILYNPDNSIKCKDSLNITVYDLPKANMLVGNSIEICFNRDYCFINNSTVGANNSPITQYLWLFGDGDISTTKNPCHRYDYSGDYLIFLNVKDSNTCESKLEKQVHVTVGSSLKPRFIVIAVDSCPVTKANFINITDTTGKRIIKFILDFGDGNKDSSVTRTNFSHTYTKDGTFLPTLTLVNWMGCRETYYPYYPITNTILNFKFDITASPQLGCWPDSVIEFSQTPPTGKISSLLWDFGDPMSGSRNYNTLNWDPTHKYSDPGVYDIYLRVEASFCKKDTTLCRFLTIKGPKARINIPGVRNNCLSDRPLPKDIFYKASSKCLNPNGDSVKYSMLTKVPPYIRSTIDTFCNALPLSYYIKKTNCRTDTIYTLKPSGVKKIYDTLNIFYDYWFPGDPIPTGSTCYPNSGKCNPQVMHDTDFFPLNCSAPNYVRFTNNSIKSRNYPAIDDKPPFTAGSMGSDQCKNPSYPWASDSLQYFWDFGDYFAPSCTSTYSNINKLCRYSTEKVPWHLYKKDGCFNVYLKVTDPVTLCSSKDSVIITMQKPDAGWDTSAYDYLNYRTQLQKPSGKPRRGMLLEGSACLGIPQLLNLSEVLPDCNSQDWGIVLDSAKECVHICTDTSYFDTDLDGKPDTLIHYKDSCNWITKSMYNLNQIIYFKTVGCKTVGLWIKSGDCVDTFWYHNYKYISDVDPQFIVLDPDTNQPLLRYHVCPGFKPVLTVKNKNQEGITSFRFDIKKMGNPNILYRKYCKLIKDTVLLLANKLSPQQTIYYPQYTCPNDPLNNMKLSDLLKLYVIKDTVFILSLEDTIFTNFELKDPGVYEIHSLITNTNGCSNSTLTSLTVGYGADFMAYDSMLCLNDTTSFPYNVYNYKGLLYNGCVVNFDYNDDGIIDTGHYFKYTKPGSYTVRMYITDTICNRSLKVEKAHYLTVGGVKAEFDTTNSPSNCAPQVVGFEDKSKLLTPYKYIYDSTGAKIDSTRFDYIIGWLWNFGDQKGTNSLSSKTNPTHAYTANGDFDVSLQVNTSLGCIDSITKPKYIRIEGPKPSFYLLDTFGCVSYAARFIDTSKRVSGWIWQLGDNTQESGSYHYGDTVKLIYNRVGVFYPNLVGTDSVYNIYMKTYTKCTSIFPDPLNPFAKKFKVTVLPINKLLFTGDTIICTGQEAFFTDLSDTTYTQINWDFGDSNTLQSNHRAKVGHTYNIDEDIILDKFTVTMNGEGSLCPDKPKTKVVTVKRVIADIMWDSNLNSDPVFCFRNYSKGGIKYDWYFKDGSPSYIKASDTNYKCTNYLLNQGIKTICLKAENEIRCKDTDCVDVENHYDIMINIPNVFTPGSSFMINDSFTVASKNLELYNITIYNRWGSVVFESNDPHKHWDGNEMIKGLPCSSGTYYYVLNYKFRYLEPKTAVGTISLFR